MEMKLAAITWGSDMALLINACKELGVELNVWSTYDVEEEKKRKECIKSLGDADILILHPTNEAYWDEIIEGLDKEVPTISFGHDSSYWSLSNVPLDVVATVNAYHAYGEAENITNMVRYIGKEVLGLDYKYENPKESLWEGIYHPDAKIAFDCLDDYFAWYKPNRKHKVGILFFRTYWASRDLEPVNALIRELENEFDVIPVFSYGMGDKELGAKSSGEVIDTEIVSDSFIQMQLGYCRAIANYSGGKYYPIADLTSGAVWDIVIRERNMLNLCKSV